MKHQVTVRPGGRQFEVEDGEAVLDAALRQGIALPYGCRGGSCGACMGAVIQGEIVYPHGTPGGISRTDITAGKALFCQAECRSDLVIEARVVENAGEIEVRNLPVRVQIKEELAHDVMRLYLKLPKSERLQFLAGQYIDIVLKATGHRRAFSMANAPHDDEYIELHIRHAPGGEFTDYVFAAMGEKALLRIEGPLGTFVLREESERPWLFVGGGTGFAPLKAMIEHAIAKGETRPMHLFWGVRSKRDLYLPELPMQWARELPNFQFTPVLSDPQTDDVADDVWAGETGWVHEAVLRAYPDVSPYDIYIGGPPVMVNACRDAFLECGGSMDHMFSDSFDYAALTRDNP